jgi:hypothetical protein
MDFSVRVYGSRFVFLAISSEPLPTGDPLVERAGLSLVFSSIFPMPPVIASLACRHKALFLSMTFASCFSSHERFTPDLAFSLDLWLVVSSRTCICLLVFLLCTHSERRVSLPASIFFFER